LGLTKKDCCNYPDVKVNWTFGISTIGVTPEVTPTLFIEQIINHLEAEKNNRFE